MGGKQKASTNYFFSYLTLSIINIDRHITLFAMPWQSKIVLMLFIHLILKSKAFVSIENWSRSMNSDDCIRYLMSEPGKY